MNFSTLYAESYDSIHERKDYIYETNQIIDLLDGNLKNNDVLDFGCGTGNHARQMKNFGFEVDGFDISVPMLDIAKLKNSDINFTNNFEDLKTNYSLVYSLFDVFSYQYTPELAINFLNKFISKIKPGGIGIFDTWNMSGVRLDPPTIRTRQFRIKGEIFERQVTPFPLNDYGSYRLDIQIKNLDDPKNRLIESHYLKAYCVEEITRLLQNFSGIEYYFRSVLNYAAELEKNAWRMAVIIRNKN